MAKWNHCSTIPKYFAQTQTENIWLIILCNIKVFAQIKKKPQFCSVDLVFNDIEFEFVSEINLVKFR